MKITRKQLKRLVEEAASNKTLPPVEDPMQSIYADQTITDPEIFEDPEAIMENFQLIKKAIAIIWQNDQILQEHINDIKSQLDSFYDS